MLQKERHPNLDFFIADLSLVAYKDDRVSMEHPMFSLSKTPDRTIREYEHNGVRISLVPSVLGHPTIWDKDVLIFCCSQLIEGMKQDREPKPEIVFGAYDFLVSTNRNTGSRGYELIVGALKRLAGVEITTNIRTGGQREDRGFHLINHWDAKFSYKEGKVRHIAVEIPSWLFRAVVNFEVLTLSRDYFRLDGGLERRVYELCRKHCGNQAFWSIGLALLHKKSGSRAPLRNFRIAIQKLTRANYLPGYRLRFDQKNDQLTVYTTGPKGALREIRDVLGTAP
jgi:plasmid replication initiation protein